MSNPTLTSEEKHNLKMVEEWARSWKLPGDSAEKMVKEIYADTTDFLVEGVITTEFDVPGLSTT